MGGMINSKAGAPYLREWHGTHCRGGWVGPWGAMNECENLSPIGIRFPDRLALASRYTDWATPIHKQNEETNNTAVANV
jgi:hypothetical protein